MGDKRKRWQRCRITEHEEMIPGTWRMSLLEPQLAEEACAGHFVMVRVQAGTEPLLNRPLGVAATDRQTGMVTFYYQVVGKGTALLAQRQVGEDIEMLAPLGNTFCRTGRKVLLVGGGIGLAPLLLAAQQRGLREMQVLAGGRTCQDLFWTELFAPWCDRVHVTTDDGSLGSKGNCVSVLPALLEQEGFDTLLVCGPEPMLKAVQACVRERKIRCQLSLETFMACGFGVCLGCTCQATNGKLQQVCKDGPVFEAAEVRL